MLFTCKSFTFSNFTWKKKLAPGNGWGGGGGDAPGPSPFSTVQNMLKVLIQNIRFKIKYTESTKRQKTSCPKEYVENADVYRPV